MVLNPYEPPHCDDPPKPPPVDPAVAMMRFFFRVSVASVIVVTNYIMYDLYSHHLLEKNVLFAVFIGVFAVMIVIILSAMYVIGIKGMERHDVNSDSRS